MVGVFWGAYTRHEAAHWQATAQEMLRWLADGRLRPLVSREYSLDEVPQALADLAARQVVGKVVVVP